MARDNIPVLDWRRWGPGVVVTLGVLFGAGTFGFVDGFLRRSAGLEILGAVSLFGAITILFVKLTEEIRPVTVRWDIVGERGEVVEGVGPNNKGVVRARSELWSAKSMVLLAPGTRVQVVRVEGNLAWVERVEP